MDSKLTYSVISVSNISWLYSGYAGNSWLKRREIHKDNFRSVDEAYYQRGAGFFCGRRSGRLSNPQKTDYEAVEPDLAALNKLKSLNAFSFFELLALLKPNLS